MKSRSKKRGSSDEAAAAGAPKSADEQLDQILSRVRRRESLPQLSEEEVEQMAAEAVREVRAERRAQIDAALTEGRELPKPKPRER